MLGSKFPGKIFTAGNRKKQKQSFRIIFRTSELGEKSLRKKDGNPPGFV
jgi:hypothetical protein